MVAVAYSKRRVIREHLRPRGLRGAMPTEGIGVGLPAAAGRGGRWSSQSSDYCHPAPACQPFRREISTVDSIRAVSLNPLAASLFLDFPWFAPAERLFYVGAVAWGCRASRAAGSIGRDGSGLGSPPISRLSSLWNEGSRHGNGSSSSLALRNGSGCGDRGGSDAFVGCGSGRSGNGDFSLRHRRYVRRDA